MTESPTQESIAARLDRIEVQLQQVVAMVADAADEWTAGLQRRGIDVDGRVDGALTLVERLTEPSTMDALTTLADVLPRLIPLVELAGTFQHTTAMVFDIADAQVARLAEENIDVEERFLQVFRLLSSLTDPGVAEHLQQLVDAAPGLMAATRTGEVFGRAVDASSAEDGARVGLWGLIRALREPEVQRAAGFAVDVCRRVGGQLPVSPSNSSF